MSLRRVLQLSIALLFGALLLAVASPAGAVDDPDYTAPPPATVVTTPPTTPAPGDDGIVRRQPTTAVAVTPARSQMAITGSDVTQTAALGVALIAGGAVVLTLRRRSAAA